MRNCSRRVSMILALVLALFGVAMAEQGKLETRVETRSEVIQAPIRYEFSRTVGRGRLVKAQDGRQGQIRRTYRVTFRDGKPVSKELLKEERTEPEPALFLMSRQGFETSRSSFGRARVLEMTSTAYDPSPQTIGRGATGRTKMGYRATFGHVAVDPKVIPLGSLVFVEGYGFAIASDIGGAIKGNKIDLCFDDRRTALAWGRRPVRVHVFTRN
jgi:3D (Asp-Asp-Asp) domain-containing protein